ncbi:MAG TPA: TolC family protein [Polyangiales bacterium]|nr:TolC family protein [Polyangiales bacterium]
MRLLLVISSLLVCLSSARAQQPGAAETISLPDLLRRASKNPPTVRRALAGLERARAEARAAGALWYPSLSVEGVAGVRYSNQLLLPEVRLDSLSYDLRSTGGLDWSALNMARGATISARDAAAESEQSTSVAAQRIAAAQAAELYLRAGAASDLIDDAKLTLERRSRQHQAISELVKTGSRSPVEAERTKVELLSAKYTLKMRESDEAAAFAALAVAIGRPPTQPVRPATRSGEFVGASSVFTAERALELAKKNRPEVQAAVFAIAALREDYRAAVLDRFPTVGVTASGTASWSETIAGYGINGSGFGASAGLYLRWRGLDPVVWLRADVAAASKIQAERALEVTQQAVSGEAVAAYYALQRAKFERERAIEVLLTAGATREAQNDRYRVGVGSLLELLDAESLEQDARQRRIEAERDEAIASARLLASCGLMVP